MTNTFFKAILLFTFIGAYFQAKSQQFKTVDEYKQFLLENIDKSDIIEGIWQFNKKVETGFYDKDYDYNKLPPTSFNIEVAPFKVAIIKGLNNNYFTYEVDIFDRITEKKYIDYHFESTAIDGQYLYNDYSPPCKDCYCTGKAFIKSDGDLYFECKNETYKNGMRSWDNYYVKATKVSPTQSEIRNKNSLPKKETPEFKPKFSYGTGSSITNDLIITCYHVIKDAKEISIRGIGGRFDTTYIAKLNFYDEDLDIAILKVPNIYLNKVFNLPYAIKQKQSEVGDNIFVLGYPLQNTMGQEIKLTTGVISSNSGFLGDTTLYQISAPIQPGNSGGPLFDNKGNLIGIVSAKHKNADNVGYAIKLNQFKEFLKGKRVNFNSNKSLPVELSKKVKLFKDYIYSIEVTLQ